MRYRQDVIEGALLDRLAEVTKREHLNELAARVNAAVARLATEIPAQEAELQKRIAAARTEAGRLVEFIAAGHVPALVREKLAELERQIEGAEAQLAAIGESGLQSAPTLHPQRLRAYLADLRGLLTHELPRAKAIISRHLDGDMMLHPATEDAPARITGRVAAPFCHE
jgi:hypothetical protein